MQGYDEKSCNALQMPFYRPVEAAIRWCGLIQNEVDILGQLDPADMVPKISQFSQWPCLRANTEKFLDAIAHGDIPYGRDGRTVSADESVAKHRRTVRHIDLKEWMQKYYPDQKPAFLFDETERKTHAAINADTFRALQADRDALKVELSKYKSDWELAAIEYHKMKAIVDSTKGQIGEKERQSLLKLVIGMAMDGYGFDPTATRSPTPKEISHVLAIKGVPLDADTVRKWLKEAAEILPGDIDNS